MSEWNGRWEKNSGCDMSGWNGGEGRIPDARHPDKVERGYE